MVSESDDDPDTAEPGDNGEDAAGETEDSVDAPAETDDTSADTDDSPVDTDDASADTDDTPVDTDTEDVADEPATDATQDSEPAHDVTDDEQTWAVVLHASAFSGLVVPFGNILGPLLVWLIKKDESPFIDESGKEALNFQLTWTMLLLVSVVTVLVGVGFLLVPIVVVAWLVIVVLATVRASEKEVYDYPLTLDLIS